MTKGLVTIRSASSRTERAIIRAQANLPRVQDRVPWWANLLKWLGVGAACAALAFVLWRTGLLFAINAGVTALIPRPIRSAATLEVKGASQEEIVATLRTDPKYEAARKAAKKKQSKEE